MVAPLILTWNRTKVSREEFIRQLYTHGHEEEYLGMAQGIGTFRGSEDYISILRSDEDGGFYFTNHWIIIKGTPDVYKPLPFKGVV